MKHTGISRIILRATASACALVVLFCAAAFARNANEISPREPAEAYMSLVRGDEARDAEDLHAAIAAYEDAHARYSRIAKAHPDWERDIVQYRILYCENQIKAGREKMGPVSDAEPMTTDESAPAVEVRDEGADAPPPAEAVAEEEPYQKRYLAVVQENEYLRRRMDELMSEVGAEGAAEGDVAGANEQLRAQLADVAKRAQESEAKVKELEGQVRELAREIAARDGREEAGAPPSGGARTDAKYRDWVGDALAREKSGDFKGALGLYERMLEKYANDATAAKGQGRCLIAMGQPDKAAQALRKRTPTIPDAELVVLLGAAYGMGGRFRESADTVGPLVQGDPWNARARGVLGAALIGLGDTDAARVELEKALAIDPQLPDVCYNLAAILSGGTPEEREKSREHYRRSLELGGAPDLALEKRLAQP